MTGTAKQILMLLAGVALFCAPAGPVSAFDLKKHDEKPIVFPGRSHRTAFPGDATGPRGMLPPAGQDRAREAVQQGEILPLSDIRRRVRDQFGGKIVAVDLAEGQEDDAPWIYDIRVLSPEGRVLSVQMDASDGQVLEVRGQR
jgi:hypothetical protein